MQTDLIDSHGKKVGNVSVDSTHEMNGVWLETTYKDRKSLMVFHNGDVGLYLGMYRNLNENPQACDFAISVNKDDVTIQTVIDGKVKQVNMSDLVKLVEKKDG